MPDIKLKEKSIIKQLDKKVVQTQNFKNALLVRCGNYIYNVSSEPEIYYNIAH